MRTVFLAVAMAAVATAVGCGAPVGQPTGKVTFKGTPVAEAEIKFVSLENPDHEFFGTSQDDGTYTVSYREMKGLPTGKYTVTIVRTTLRNNKPIPAGEEGQAARDSDRAVKKAYQFEKDIVEGSSAIDFELSQGTEVQIED